MKMIIQLYTVPATTNTLLADRLIYFVDWLVLNYDVIKSLILYWVTKFSFLT